MKLLLHRLLFPLLLIISLNSEAQHSKLSTANAPAWVTVNEIDYNNQKLESEAEDGLLNLRIERQVSLRNQSRYYKRTIKILSEAGVQNGSEISVNFDPVYEQLTFNSVLIIRDGKQINKLQLAKFKTIQQEKELARHTYDGSLTALLVLDDVRKDDIIEYSYTIKGFNPIFKGKYAGEFDCNFAVPVANIYYKLIVADKQDITIKNRQTNIQPAMSKSGDETVYEWRLQNVAALHLESKTPDWYDPYASVLVSEFTDWAMVSNWAVPLFPQNPHISAPLLNKINTIKTSYNSDEERTLAALHFVQDEIRYTATETGVYSHKPNQPDKIFAQRFGDCKDKSYLLVTMLQAMGIEAHPVLINTVDKKIIEERLPSPHAFDHCTVQVKIKSKIYWFDPTISFQRGPIDKISYPDYQVGLVVSNDTKNLASIPFNETGVTDVQEIFIIGTLSGKSYLKVITANTGSYADAARYDFTNNSVYEMKNRYKNFYASYFDKINADSLTYKSNDTSGSFTTTEYYTIDDIWKKEKNKTKIDFTSFVIDGNMSKPADKNRTMPFRLTYPLHVRERLELTMPEDWPIKTFDETINAPGFQMTGNGASEGNKVNLNYEYESLQDYVMPADAQAFFANYDAADNDLGYQLYYSGTLSDSQNTSSDGLLANVGLFPKLYMLLGLCVLITYFYKNRKKETS